MIEVATSPANLADWKPKEQPFYLELYGETSPLVDEAYAEVVPAGGTDPKATADAPVYEYWWTLGHPGAPEEHRHWLEDDSDKRPWQEVADPAARVYLYFPILSGWRANEIVATLKYLSPVPEQHDWLKTVAQDFHAVQPLMGGAASIAGLVPGAATASKWLDTISKAAHENKFINCKGIGMSTVECLPKKKLGGIVPCTPAISKNKSVRSLNASAPFPMKRCAA